MSDLLPAPDPSRPVPRDAQSYFETSFHANPALMSIARLSDFKMLEANAAFLKGCGFTREQVIGRTGLELGLWVERRQREEFVRRIRSDRQVRDFEAEFRNQQGTNRTFLLNADVFELQGQNCVLTIGVDITDRRRRDQVQAATYQISRVVFTGGDFPMLFAEVHRIIGALMPAKNFYVALLSDDGREVSFPYFVDEHIESPPPRAPANGFTEYILHTGLALRATAPELAALLSQRGAYQPLGRPAAVRIGAPLLADGRAIGVIALQDYHDTAAYDVDDLQLLTFVAEQTAAAVRRRQAELALARAEQNYRSIFVNAVEGLYVSSPEGKFLRANPALARMFGYRSPEELLTDINDIRRQVYVQPGRRDEFFALVQRSDEVTDFESEVYRRDGSRLWISESVRVVRNADGSVDHFEGVAVDVTERREAAEALRVAKEAADAASRAKSYFLASVSHELRTPLNGILGYTQILQRDSALTERQRDGVRVIHDSADHLLALINDVLDFSKIEAGRIELHPTDFDLAEFATGIERAFVPRAREKMLLLETALPPSLPRWVRGDEQRLRQVLFNLVGNAVKFTARGGVVFSVESVDDAKKIRFSVSDTGPGIADHDVPRLFEPFTQLARQSSHSTGTGLGLAISRSLVEKMGGELHVETKPGWGSRFWFDLPLPAVAAPVTTATAFRPVVGYEGPRRRVLVIDDNAANRSVLTAMLTPLGFAVTEAPDAETGLAAYEQTHPDLVLMDLRLPGGMDGLAATRELRQRPRTPDQPLKIIAVSASAYDIDRRECFTAGCDDFLAKPFREEELWAAIERALGLRWLFSDPDQTRSPFPLVVHAPPAVDAAAIHELALKGDVIGIRERAQALMTRDPRLAPFAQGVLDLAARFRMKAIRQFVARYVPTPPASSHD